jgi:hypothetical protein
MPKFPVDAPNKKKVRALDELGFPNAREKEHISLERMTPERKKSFIHSQSSQNKNIDLKSNLHL